MKCSDCGLYMTRECTANPLGFDWDMAEKYDCFEYTSTGGSASRVIKDIREKQPLGELLLDGGDWQVHRGGITSRDRTILWNEINEVYVGASNDKVDPVSADEKMSIAVVDYYKNRIEITLSGFSRTGTKDRNEFTDIYGLVLHNVLDRQVKQALISISGGKRVSFKAFEIARDAIYYAKGAKQLFRNNILDYANLKQSTVVGC